MTGPAGPLDVLKDVLDRFDKIGITDYFLVGSLASMVYGKPRFTNDIDLVVQLPSQRVRSFEAAFPLADYYCPPREVLEAEVVQRGSFNLIHQGSGIKVDIVLVKPTEFYDSELRRRRKLKLSAGFEAFVASPEDVILKKLDYYREGGSEKHLVDIAGVLAATPIDQAYLETWVSKLGLQDQWDRARKR